MNFLFISDVLQLAGWPRGKVYTHTISIGPGFETTARRKRERLCGRRAKTESPGGSGLKWEKKSLWDEMTIKTPADYY